MDWLGIGVLVIGIAFAVLVGILIKPMMKLTETIEDVRKTTSKLPKTVDDVSIKTAALLDTGNAALQNVNKQINEIDPYFGIVGDIGEASRQLTTSVLDKAENWKSKTTGARLFTEENRYKGLLGLAGFIYFLNERKELEQTVKEISQNEKDA